MNIRRRTHLLLTSVIRATHRRGFGVQSPWAYELVRDVLFEPLPYYAYEEQHLHTQSEQQLFRIRNHYRHQPIVVINEKRDAATRCYEAAIRQVTPDTVLIVEHIHNENADLWTQIVADSRAIITFDMRRRGLVIFDTKRVKQNYLL